MIKNRLKQYYNYIISYMLIILGLIMISWMIWSKFLRERFIRDIPDPLLTEYRFWILFYICFIYLYVLKHLFKPVKKNNLFTEISGKILAIFLLPLKSLDNHVKYNIYIKKNYQNLMYIIIENSRLYANHHLSWLIFLLQIFPRMALVAFLLMDTFYFKKLELFYKIVFIGILPFAFRYIKYSLKQFLDHMIEQLKEKYDKVTIFEKGYKWDLSHKKNTKALYHYETVSIEAYIQIKYDTWLDEINNISTFQYVCCVFAKDEVYDAYALEKYHDIARKLTVQDYDAIDTLFHDVEIKIFELQKFVNMRFYALEQENKIKFLKIAIFSGYLLSWSFILMVSYYYYPVEFHMFRYFSFNLENYLILMGEPFALLHQHSFNKNLITIENIKNLINIIWNNISSR